MASSPPTIPSHRPRLAEWSRFLAANGHVFRRNPRLLFQQAANQPDSDAPAEAASLRSRSEGRPWFRWLNKPQVPDPWLLTLSGHSGRITDIAYAADGSRIVSGSADHTVKVWDAGSGTELLTLQGHAGPIRRCLFSPGGDRIFSGAADNMIRCWDAVTGELLAELAGHGLDGKTNLNSLALSPDGRRLLSWGGRHQPFSREASIAELRLWNADSHQLIADLVGHADWMKEAAFSPDGSRIVSCSDRWDPALKVWDAETGRALETLSGHRGPVRTFAFEPDGKRLVSASEDKTVRWWDLSTGSELACLSTAPYAPEVCGFSQDGRRLVAAWPVLAWDTVTRKSVAFDEQSLPLLAFDGSRIGGWHRGWNGSHLPLRSSPDGTRALGVLPDGITIGVFDPDDLRHSAPTTGHDAAIRALAFAPGGRLLSGADDGSLLLWEEGGREAKPLRDGDGEALDACAFAPDARVVISVSTNKMVEFRDPETGVELLRLAFLNPVAGCAFSPDGGRLLTASYDEATDRWRPTVWTLTNGEQLTRLSGHVEDVSACAFGPDGTRVLSASRAGDTANALKLWSLEDATCRRTFTGHTGGVTSCGFDPSGQRVASGGADHTVKLWDVQSPHAVRNIPAHRSAVRAVSWSPDGALLASSGDDGLVRVWNGESGTLACEYEIGPPVGAVAWSPDGSLLAIADDSRPRLLKLENRILHPIVVTGWNRPGHGRDEEVYFGCPVCREWSAGPVARVGSELACPRCSASLKLNPFTLKEDWRPVASGWSGQAPAWRPDVGAWPRTADWGWFPVR